MVGTGLVFCMDLTPLLERGRDGLPIVRASLEADIDSENAPPPVWPRLPRSRACCCRPAA